MKIESIYQSAVYGVERGLQRIVGAANEIAGVNSSSKPAEIAKNLVESKQGVLDVKANLTLIKTEDEILGNLFDDSA